ncbi:cytochrome P450 [Mycobacteroides abscessus V06705]|nr:cytochrome P450 [Mycobacteroides abscessus V06705]
MFAYQNRLEASMTTVESKTAVVLPPGPSLPKTIQGAAALINRRLALRAMRHRFGSAFTVDLPIFGRAVVLSEPALIRQLFKSTPDEVDIVDANLGRVMGPNSMFALTGERHRAHRKLMTPPFHGRRLSAYETIVENESTREFATWPIDQPFATMPSMMRITLNVILRAVFGAEGEEFEQLRILLPKMVELGSKLALVPLPQWDWGSWSPWGRFSQYRREYDAIVGRLFDKGAADPGLDERNDVLALMMQSRYEDGTSMTRSEIADELITLLSAGHETTATTLAWAVERLQRHPRLLDRLVADIDVGSDQLLEATITEVQRTRPVIDTAFRSVRAPTLTIGPWTLPQGQTIIAGIGLLHADDAVYADAKRFDPDRFIGTHPDTSQWIPFGGGLRRCIGAAFATMEMRVVLRTLLRDFTITSSTAAGERWHSRGVAIAPSRGGRVRLRLRNQIASAPVKQC